MALSHEQPDIVPFSLGFGVNEPVRAQMAPVLGLPNAAAVKSLLESQSDLCWIAPRYTGPKDRVMRRADGTIVDVWGIERRDMCYGEGTYEEISRYVLADLTEPEQLAEYRWPSLDWYDYGVLLGLIEASRRDGARAVVIGNANIFETAWYMRGLENMLVDLVANPEMADAILSRVEAFYEEFFIRSLDAAKGCVDLVFTSDDIGQQNGLIMSLELWKRSIQPLHARLCRLIHQAGAKDIYHTDGAVMDAIPGLIDMGVDVLEALQFDAQGMDPALMKRLYGDRLCFHGGISVQSTLPFGTPEQVEREVRDRIDVLGAGGGYLLATSHAVQAGTPVENVLAFFRAAGRPLI